ncbi:hypothetical protein [Cytobacillus oceanisediminis]|nr:hypothetical protein [Cytobacillus oceanisediminis]
MREEIERGLAMYVDNIRTAISELKPEEYKEYLERLRLVLRKNYSKNVKPSELKQRVDEFVAGRDPKIDSFESYLLTFDEFTSDGAINALNKKKVNMPTTWRELLIKVTEDRTISPDIMKHLEDEQIIKEVKTMFQLSIKFCSSNNHEQFYNQLYQFNQFLKIGMR